MGRNPAAGTHRLGWATLRCQDSVRNYACRVSLFDETGFYAPPGFLTLWLYLPFCRFAHGRPPRARSVHVCYSFTLPGRCRGLALCVFVILYAFPRLLPRDRLDFLALCEGLPWPSPASHRVSSWVQKPTINAMVARLEWPPDISGTSSSMTTYIMAPAAKLSRYGITGSIIPMASIVSIPAIGSTIPDSTPYTKALSFELPVLCNGMDMIAPSGRKFCMAIPIASERAAALVMVVVPDIQLA